MEFKKYINSKSKNKIASIIATILSFTVSVFGLSNIRLSIWWHYLCSFLLLIMLHLILYFIVIFAFYIYFKYFKTAKFVIDKKNAVNLLKLDAHDLFLAIEESKKTHIDEYKGILNYEIKNKYESFANKLEFIRENINNSQISDINKIPIDEKEFKEYARFEEYIRNNLKIF